LAFIEKKPVEPVEPVLVPDIKLNESSDNKLPVPDNMSESENEDEKFLDLVKQRIENSITNTLSIFTRQYTTPLKGIRAVSKQVNTEEYKLVILGRRVLEVKEKPYASLLGSLSAELLTLSRPTHILIMQKSEQSPKYSNGLI